VEHFGDTTFEFHQKVGVRVTPNIFFCALTCLQKKKVGVTLTPTFLKMSTPLKVGVRVTPTFFFCSRQSTEKKSRSYAYTDFYMMFITRAHLIYTITFGTY